MLYCSLNFHTDTKLNINFVKKHFFLGRTAYISNVLAEWLQL